MGKLLVKHLQFLPEQLIHLGTQCFKYYSKAKGNCQKIQMHMQSELRVILEGCVMTGDES